MPAPMLESVDEELLLSRGANQWDEHRYRRYIDEAFLHSSKPLSTILDQYEKWLATIDSARASQQLNRNPDGTFSIVDPVTSIPHPGTVGMEKKKFYRCEVCGKRYKNLNGLKYHRQHSPPCNPDFKLNPQNVPGMPNNMQ
jgi:hypothetical protein